MKGAGARKVKPSAPLCCSTQIAGKGKPIGARYGATTIAGGDGSRQPSETELEGARHLGKRVADTANKLFG